MRLFFSIFFLCEPNCTRAMSAAHINVLNCTKVMSTAHRIVLSVFSCCIQFFLNCMKLHGILFELYKADREMKTADNAKIFNTL